MRAPRCAVAALLALAAGLAAAQAPYPSKPVRLVVPWPPGGSSDIVARLVAERAGVALKQPVVVENRPGASGKIGSEAVSRAAPDGYTFLLANSISHASITLTDRQLSYDPAKDFAPITLATQTPLILAVHPSVPATTVSELVAVAKARPNALNFASPGPGSAHHLMGEWFRSRAGIDIVHVPYKGIAPAQAELVAGTVQMIFDPSIAQQVRDGRLRGLATTGAERSPLARELPTMIESGYRDMVLVGWNGFVAPAGTPRAVVDRLNATIVAAIADPAVAKRLLDVGLIPTTGTPEQMASQIVGDLALYRAIVADNRLKLE
jgi:tripartite-type tricarboxylate transporter receptor subunit TctC